MIHSLYNDNDGKTRNIIEYLRSIDDDTNKQRSQRLNEALHLAQQGHLNEALEHIGYTNDATPLHIPNDEKR